MNMKFNGRNVFFLRRVVNKVISVKEELQSLLKVDFMKLKHRTTDTSFHSYGSNGRV